MGSGAKPPSPNPSPSVAEANQLFEPTHFFWAGYATECHDLLYLIWKWQNGCFELYLLNNPYYNLPYNPSAPFVRSGFLVSYRIRSAMKFPQNVLHYIWHTSRVYVIHIKSLSRYFQLTQNWTDKAKWRSIEASNNVNKHTGHGLLAVDSSPE